MNRSSELSNPTAALPHLERACALAPRQPQGWLHAGVCLTQLGRYDEALMRLQEARALDENNPLVFTSLADLFRLTGQLSAASEAYRKALSLGDTSALTLAKLGSITVQLGHHDIGLARIHKAISLDERAGELQEILATSAFLAGKSKTACEAAEQRLTMKSATVFHFVLAATLYLHTRQGHKAAEVLDRAEKVFKHHPDLSVMRSRLQARAAS